MIIFVVTHAHAYTVKGYLDTWGVGLRSRARLLYYEDILCRRSLPRGTYIFTDLERLSQNQLRQSELLAEYLAKQGMTVLNRPGRVLRRYDLLNLLYTQSVNPFRAVWFRDVDDSLRYPAFLRRENEHDGPISALLHSREDLYTAAEGAVSEGADPDSLLAVEFCDTVDEAGLYRKYSAFLIGDCFVPRHILSSEGWVTKFPDKVDEREIEGEQRYVFEEPNPHESQIRFLFQRAVIDYGRIDYALLKGEIIVWEINTNPTIATPLSRTNAVRVPVLREVSAKLRAAFETLSDRPGSLTGAPLSIPANLRVQMGIPEWETVRLPLRQSTRPVRLWFREKKTYLRRFYAVKTKNASDVEN